MKTSVSRPDFMLGLIAAEDFLKDPPFGFTVEKGRAGHSLVMYEPDSCCVFINDFVTAGGSRVVFQNSTGNTALVENLGDYTKLRNKMTSKLILLMVSACERKPREKAEKATTVIKQFFLIINGRSPWMQQQLEEKLNQAISSVAGESYTVKLDLKECLQTWTYQTNFVLPHESRFITPDWQNTSFTLKYNSDALFDFPYWFGFSKRNYTIQGKITYLKAHERKYKFALEKVYNAHQ
ncbi:mesenteric estrogen-dependent adipogenesis protein-like [Rhinatrema bivittatum]|uniref:mesenteric estrogen-dependent adipogenesis protein-like n=1 Tax=Rhinatrema bivittatum TaxID=194408 RepID=UPI00112BEDE8|nr:mesenteric estrogen-dependent adipogenesis protein-like [Rhinatrema bivittatum]